MSIQSISQHIASGIPISVAMLSTALGPSRLATFLEQSFDAHYPFRKADWERLFGSHSLEVMRSVSSELWFDFRHVDDVRLNYWQSPFCICIDHLTKNFMLVLLSRQCKLLKITLDYRMSESEIIFSIPNTIKHGSENVIASIRKSGRPPLVTSSVADVEAGWVCYELDRIKSILNENPRRKDFKFRIKAALCSGFWERHFANDPRFRNRHIITRCLAYEVILDIASTDSVKRLIIKWKNDIQNDIIRDFLNWENVCKMWLIGCDDLFCFPKELIRFIRMMFVRPLFI